MNREIKYRGLNKKEGWVYGTPLFNKLGAFIITEENPHVCDQYGYIEICEFMDVDLDSVTQYTGLKDKNGVDIYESDIVAFKVNYSFDEPPEPKYNTRNGTKMIDVVKFQEGAFFFTDSIGRGGYARKSYKYCKVIGNIYENPELLEKNQ